MRHFDGETGRGFEERTIGKVMLADWDGSYVPFRKALEMVRKNQPESLPRVGKILRKQIVLALIDLGFQIKDWNEVEFLTAVGSPLDCPHCVDLVISWRGHEVLVDLTVNSHKTKSKSPEIILCRPENVEDLDRISAFAHVVAEALREGEAHAAV